MGRFRLKPKCGNHIERDKKGKPVTYTSKSGHNIVESDRDLVTAFPGKFEVVPEQFSEDVPTAPDIPEPSKKEKKITISPKKVASKKTEIPESEYGVDVTKEFPTASEVELKVFEKLKWFTVVDPDNNEVLNDKKLRRDKVEGFLADYLRDEEDEDEDENEDEDGGDEDEGD